MTEASQTLRREVIEAMNYARRLGMVRFVLEAHELGASEEQMIEKIGILEEIAAVSSENQLASIDGAAVPVRPILRLVTSLLDEMDSPDGR